MHRRPEDAAKKRARDVPWRFVTTRTRPDATPPPRVPPAASASRRGRAALGALGRAPGIPPVLSLASDPDDPDDHDDPDEHIPLEELAELEALVSSAVAALDDADASPAPRGSRLFAGGASLAPDAVLREAGPGVADVLVVRAAREKRDAPSLTDETVDDLSSHLTPRQRAMIRRAIRLPPIRRGRFRRGGSRRDARRTRTTRRGGRARTPTRRGCGATLRRRGIVHALDRRGGFPVERRAETVEHDSRRRAVHGGTQSAHGRETGRREGGGV